MNPTEIKNRIIKYCPSFVRVENSLFLSLIGAISTSISALSEEIKGLNAAIFSGKALRLFCKEGKIFYSVNESDEAVRARYQNQFSILQKRGTESGIIDDIRSLAGNVTIEIFGVNDSGIIVDKTYVGVDNQAVIDAGKMVWIHETNRMLMEDFSALLLEDGSYLLPGNTPVDVKNKLDIIKREVVPIDAQIIYEI